MKRLSVLVILLAGLLLLGILLTGCENPEQLGSSEDDINSSYEKIVFKSYLDDPEQSEIYVLDTVSYTMTRLTENPFYDNNPNWSPDGSKIAFDRSNLAGNSDIYIINHDGTGEQKLTFSDADDDEPAWSPDGSKIVYTTYRNGTSDIYMINADGTNDQPLISDQGIPIEDALNQKSPDWSVDNKIVFIANTNDMDENIYDDNDFEVCVLDRNTNQIDVLTENSLNESKPAWSPDGSKIAYISEYNLWVMNSDGSEQRLLLDSPNPIWDVDWSPDGRKLIISINSDSERELYVIDAVTANIIANITNNSVLDDHPSWSLNRQW